MHTRTDNRKDARLQGDAPSQRAICSLASQLHPQTQLVSHRRKKYDSTRLESPGLGEGGAGEMWGNPEKDRKVSVKVTTPIVLPAEGGTQGGGSMEGDCRNQDVRGLRVPRTAARSSSERRLARGKVGQREGWPAERLASGKVEMWRFPYHPLGSSARSSSSASRAAATSRLSCATSASTPLNGTSFRNFRAKATHSLAL